LAAVSLELLSGDYVEVVTFVRTPEGQNQTNRTHWKVASRAGTWPIPRTVDLMSQEWSDILLPVIPATHTYYGALMRRINGVKTQLIPSIIGQSVGDLMGDPLPSQVSAVISKRASSAPPRARGRFYCPSPTEAENNATGDPSAAYLTALEDLGDFLSLDLTLTDGADNIVLSPVIARFDPPGTFFDAWEVDQYIVRSRWGTQRRRSEINRPDRVPF